MNTTYAGRRPALDLFAGPVREEERGTAVLKSDLSGRRGRKIGDEGQKALFALGGKSGPTALGVYGLRDCSESKATELSKALGPSVDKPTADALQRGGIDTTIVHKEIFNGGSDFLYPFLFVLDGTDPVTGTSQVQDGPQRGGRRRERV